MKVCVCGGGAYFARSGSSGQANNTPRSDILLEAFAYFLSLLYAIFIFAPDPILLFDKKYYVSSRIITPACVVIFYVSEWLELRPTDIVKDAVLHSHIYAEDHNAPRWALGGT